jgi:uronate dehydrogenase
MSSPPLFHRLLLTGAQGRLGRVLRPRLRDWATVLRVSDRVPLAPAVQAGEEGVPCDLADRAAVLELLQGVDAVVHMGGISREDRFDAILQSNIVGVFNLYEAARKHGVRRVVFASSNHVTGFYRQDETIRPDAVRRPDGLYGVSKCFGEDLSRYYFDRFGIETVCLRIGASFPEVRDRRMLATYLSHDDLTELVRCALTAPAVGHSVIYGVSDNKHVWWDNRQAAHLGFVPRDSSEPMRSALEANTPEPDPRDPAAIYQGGGFVVMGPFDD